MNKKYKKNFIKKISNNNLLNWAVPFIEKRRPLSNHKKSVSLGAAIGSFFAIITPVGQIPLAICLSILLKGNIIFASATTFISNPITYIPLYLIAYGIGFYILTKFLNYDFETEIGLSEAGLAILIGLIILSITLSILIYFSFRLYFFFKALKRYIKIKKFRYKNLLNNIKKDNTI